MEKEDKKQDECLDYDGKAARFTLALLMGALIIWLIYERVKMGETNGTQVVLICSITLTFNISKRYLMKKDSKRKRESEIKE